MSEHPLIEMVKQKVVPLGMQCFTTDPAFVEVLGLAGFDFVMLDTEHAPNNPRAMEAMVRAAECVGLMPFVRVPDAHGEPDIRRALEAGATGIFLPMVRSADDVKAAASAAFFPPKGERGVCPAMRASRYSLAGLEAYALRNNEQTLLIPIIEHPQAVERIDEICALDDVKVIAFGVGDLSYAMGKGFEMMSSPEVRDAYERVLGSARKHGVAVVGGPVLGGDASACRKALDDGITVFSVGLDLLGFRKFCEQMSDAVSKGLAETTFTRAKRLTAEPAAQAK
jgi:2-keto-3-deoxy-L-rhamnonate aldolase RhmA